MLKGFTGKILHVDLVSRKFFIEEPDESFYRKYIGGSCIGAYYLLNEMPKGVNALDPANILVFSTSPTTGAPISGASRNSVVAKSPLSGGIGCGEAGGFWGPELKFAGFDAIVITGKSESPVYLWIQDGSCTIRSAESIWGKITGEAYDAIKSELRDEKIRIALIGPGGENMVRYACISFDLDHFCGRTGLGAVMGSKNLKAIAVRGKNSCKFFDKASIIDMAKVETNNTKVDNFWAEIGTLVGVKENQLAGGLPTHNFSSGDFDGWKKISGKTMADTILKKRASCWACTTKCKRVVELDEPYYVDPRYGGPEYETIGMLGSNLDIDNLKGIAKINELCNKNTIDTISLGGTLGFVMECLEKKIISEKDTGDLAIKFGDEDTVIRLVEMIANREGFGDVLAEGSKRIAEMFGTEAEKIAVQTKGVEWPAHMPQIKASLALAYACNPFGADHQSSQHDPMMESEPISDTIKGLGLYKAEETKVLNYEKVKLFAYSQKAYCLLDSLDLCQFIFGFGANMNKTVDLLRFATGWETNLWELMLVGERRLNMFRAFNQREGFDSKDDTLPFKVYSKDLGGKYKAEKVDINNFNKSKKDYYSLIGWDTETGNPTETKLKELGIDWVLDL